MIEKEKWTMSKKEFELEAILVRLGYRKYDARVLIYMIIFEHGSTREIEQIMNLRQPEVSLAASKLIKEGLLKAKDKKLHTKKGRPVKIYSLAKNKEQILDILCKIGNDKIKEVEGNIQSLKHLLINDKYA